MNNDMNMEISWDDASVSSEVAIGDEVCSLGMCFII